MLSYVMLGYVILCYEVMFDLVLQINKWLIVNKSNPCVCDSVVLEWTFLTKLITPWDLFHPLTPCPFPQATPPSRDHSSKRFIFYVFREMEEQLQRTQEIPPVSLLVGWKLSLELTFFTFFRSKSDVSLSPTAERGLISRAAACFRAVKTHGIIFFFQLILVTP